MNIAVSFSLRFAENMLNMSLGSFQIAPSSIYRVITLYIIFQAFFCFLMTCLLNQNTFNMSNPQYQVSNFNVNNAYSGQTLSLRSYVE